ncbi:hybrid sensor histidine kinase/response regulator [Mucilaginibacter limnophilus]|uniref:histidine kinase n=1 Tax=Mucilaginibacter limnophilus TaxID=1932778 RepID=A0A3S2Y2G3_9SPHI|nr:hybrid sensor histidine kinase/response regulator [Mucilaginibacter limnophilus]RVU00369.1 hybrid sensor histidine kinase/response regulator [Mucilaginibacter limnophilus]
MILLVDDKSENLIALRKTLESRGFEIDTALSGEEALKKVLKTDYQLIILDVQMPGMDGFEVAEAISGFSKTRDIPIIFLSAVNVSKKFITKGYEAGGRDYLVKPFDTDILVLKIRTFIKLHEQTTELNTIQQSLLKEIAQRKQAESKKDEFIGIASHELNTPLTSVKGYLQLAERQLEKDQVDQAKMFIGRSKAQVEKLNHLVSDLLNATRIETGKLNYKYTEFELEPFIGHAVDSVLQSYPDVQINTDVNGSVKIYGDETRLEQVLVNFLTNAVKYAPESNNVWLTARLLPGDLVEVRVRDEGIGIPKEKQPYIFDKFYRVEDNHNQFQGLGMGLYICSEIIKHHGGEYGLESEPGSGSTFYFRIPLKAVQ